jgi:hypothetical protein
MARLEQKRIDPWFRSKNDQGQDSGAQEDLLRQDLLLMSRNCTQCGGMISRERLEAALK